MAGLSVESMVHVKDLARGYVTLLHFLERESPGVVLENPYFFCENGEFSWREVAENIARGLVKAGRIEREEVREIPREMWGDLFGKEFSGAVVGLNSRSRAVRLRKLGWEPREKGLWESYREDELPEILKEEHVDFKGYAGPVAS